MASQTNPQNTRDASSEEVRDSSSEELFVHHSDHPNYVLSTSLLNERNYNHWKRSVEVSLMVKNKLGLVNGTCVKPSQNSPLHGQWERCNSMVISWLLHSVEKEIAESILYCRTASQIWKELGSRFGKSNRTRLFQVQRELSSMLQGNTSVSTYFTKHKKFWDEYMLLIEDCVCTCGSSIVVTNIMQDQQVVQFLMGLNESFNPVRGTILMMDPSPDMDTVYRMILQEEQQRGIGSVIKSDSDAMAFAAQRNSQRNFPAANTYGPKTGQRLFCDHCRVGGHSVENCWKLHGYPNNDSVGFCDHCKIKGHTLDICWKVHGYPPGKSESKFFCDHCKVGGHTMDRC